MTDLPKLVCGGCRTCCLGDTITLTPRDDASSYRTTVEKGRLVLAKGDDGNCTYLTATGCSIYDRQPEECRHMDCRKYAAWADKQPATEQAWRNAHPQIGPVLAEGRKRLAALRPQ
jgi:Fe-S-cluster containining protein